MFVFFLAIFAFRSVGAYSRVQIRSVKTGRWLCMNTDGKITQKVRNSLQSDRNFSLFFLVEYHNR